MTNTNTIDIATTVGSVDAQTWLEETPHTEWARAIAPGALGADDALINAVGTERAARYLGVGDAIVNGELTQPALDALERYAIAWRRRVADALDLIATALEREEP